MISKGWSRKSASSLARKVSTRPRRSASGQPRTTWRTPGARGRAGRSRGRGVASNTHRKQRGGLRLDNGRQALEGGNSGPAFVAGNSVASRLIHLVAGLEADRRMPPGEGKQLSREQIALLRAWIDQGAKWPAARTSSTA